MMSRLHATIDETPDPSGIMANAADVQRVAEVAAAGFEGPLWDALIEELTKYAWPRLHGLIYKGTIGQVSTGSPHPALSPELHQLLRQSVDHRDELVVEALLRAPEKFREHLRAGRWDPEKGKSLPSYYLGSVAAAFWARYQSWERRLRAERKALAAIAQTLPAETDLAGPDLDLRMSQQAALLEILTDADPWQRAIAGRILAGHTQVEIAHELGLSVGAVGVRMRGLRKSARRLVAAGAIDATILPRERTQADRRGAA